VLLRNRLQMVGVEMWVKIYSPLVKGIEVVKRAERRARRGRLFYMRYVCLSFIFFTFLRTDVLAWGVGANRWFRKPKHDRGSVEGDVEEYLKRRRLIRSGALGVKEPKMSAKNPQQARAGVGAR